MYKKMRVRIDFENTRVLDERINPDEFPKIAKKTKKKFG